VSRLLGQTIMTKEQILESYKECGYNAQNLIHALHEKLKFNGCDESFDGSLVMFHTKEFSVLVSTCGVQFFKELS